MLRIIPLALLLTTLTASCDRERKASVTHPEPTKSEPGQHYLVNEPGDSIPKDVSFPIQGKRIDPDSVAKPKTIPLQGTPEIQPSRINIFPAGQPKVTPLPKSLVRLPQAKTESHYLRQCRQKAGLYRYCNLRPCRPWRPKLEMPPLRIFNAWM
jgi:hypothetical protein